jgi:hypothetical protein
MSEFGAGLSKGAATGWEAGSQRVQEQNRLYQHERWQREEMAHQGRMATAARTDRATEAAKQRTWQAEQHRLTRTTAKEHADRAHEDAKRQFDLVKDQGDEGLRIKADAEKRLTKDARKRARIDKKQAEANLLKAQNEEARYAAAAALGQKQLDEQVLSRERREIQAVRGNYAELAEKLGAKLGASRDEMARLFASLMARSGAAAGGVKNLENLLVAKGVGALPASVVDNVLTQMEEMGGNGQQALDAVTAALEKGGVQDLANARDFAKLNTELDEVLRGLVDPAATPEDVQGAKVAADNIVAQMRERLASMKGVTARVGEEWRLLKDPGERKTPPGITKAPYSAARAAATTPSPDPGGSPTLDPDKVVDTYNVSRGKGFLFRDDTGEVRALPAQDDGRPDLNVFYREFMPTVASQDNMFKAAVANGIVPEGHGYSEGAVEAVVEWGYQKYFIKGR